MPGMSYNVGARKRSDVSNLHPLHTQPAKTYVRLKYDGENHVILLNEVFYLTNVFLMRSSTKRCSPTNRTCARYEGTVNSNKQKPILQRV